MEAEDNKIKIGSRVRCNIETGSLSKTYPKGHEFTVTGDGGRGWDLIDDEGNELIECAFIHKYLELIKQ